MNVGVLLAAGASSRMGSPKALVMHKGQSFLVHGVRHLWSACDVVVVVLGADAKKIRSAIEQEFAVLVEGGALTPDLHAARKHGARGLEVRFETNAAWKKGMLSSAVVGLSAALKLKAESILLLPVDNPHVSGETVAEIAALMGQALKAFGGGKPAKASASAAGGSKGSKSPGFAYALVPRVGGHRGHPVALTPALARAIVRDKAAEHLGDAIRRNARLIGYADVADKGVLANVNTPAARRKK
jgi:CTP:molybdopterin cytidylyltransferase MocA